MADFHLGLADFHSPWDQGHVGEEAENPCHSLQKIFPPCSSALDPSLEEEGVVPCSSALDPSPEEEGIVPPSLEGEGGDLEEGFPAACSV